MPRKQIEAIIGELRSWLPNYDHGPADYPTLLYRILASAPGGEELEDMGYEPFNLGWQEIDQLGRVLEAIQDKRDVEDIVAGLIHDEEEEVEEARGEEESNGVSEGRDYPITYVLYLESAGRGYTPMEWRTRARYGIPGYGAPTDANLERYVRRFEADTQPGGANAHLGPTIISRARIVDQRTGQTVARYEAPRFQVIEATEARRPRARARRR